MTGPPTDSAVAASRWAADLIETHGLDAQVMSVNVTWTYPIGATCAAAPHELQVWITLRSAAALRMLWESTGRPRLEVVRERDGGQPVRLLAHYDDRRQCGLAAVVQGPKEVAWVDGLEEVRGGNRALWEDPPPSGLVKLKKWRQPGP